MFQITNLTKKQVSKIPWKKIKEEVLGKKYELSLIFAGNALLKKLNFKYRKKNKPASVLSFPLSKTEGEIFINLSQKNHSPLYLFIHALLHLKGLRHSAKMEVQEEKLMKKYRHGAKHYYRA
jgi:ssRNA-specific RNase YbeY (16S rRNA maturation enzyme)